MSAKMVSGNGANIVATRILKGEKHNSRVTWDVYERYEITLNCLTLRDVLTPMLFLGSTISLLSS